jgi:hypothetical protein
MLLYDDKVSFFAFLRLGVPGRSFPPFSCSFSLEGVRNLMTEQKGHKWVEMTGKRNALLRSPQNIIY